MSKWRIGAVTVTRILEMEHEGIVGSEFLMPDATPEAVRRIAWLAPHFADTEGRLKMSFHAFLVETPTAKILVDTCIGADKERGIPDLDRLQTPFLENLAAANCPRESVDTVLCTHLHIDHVGWNTMRVDGRWVPTFPNARFLLHEAEFEYWRAQKDDHIHEIVFADSVKPVWDAGLVSLVATDYRVCEEVRLVPTPGHTPGHVSVLISSQGEEALITGDFVHHPCQFVHPEWGTVADSDRAQAVTTRRTKFGEFADSPILVLGTHFMPPTAGRVVRDGDAFRFEPRV